MFEAVLFDFDGTLVDYQEADTQSLRQLLASTGSTVPFSEFLDISVEEIMIFHELVANRKIDPGKMHDFRLRNTFARFNMVWQDDYVSFYRKNLIELCVPLPGIQQLLSGIKGKTKMGLVTNAHDGDEQRERIRHAGLDSYFDVIAIAGEVGVYKPDPALFLYALNRLQISSGKALFVGNSAAYDIAGAKNAGLHSVLLTKNPQTQGEIADYVVQDAYELRTLLERVIA